MAQTGLPVCANFQLSFQLSGRIFSGYCKYNIKEKTEGTNIFVEAVKYPYKTILKNAGLEYVPQKGKGKGINVITGKTVDMINEGIIDPTKVTCSALENAKSVSSLMLTTESVIADAKEDEE